MQKVQDAEWGLAALRWDAVAGTRAQLFTYTAGVSAWKVQYARDGLAALR